MNYHYQNIHPNEMGRYMTDMNYYNNNYMSNPNAPTQYNPNLNLQTNQVNNPYFNNEYNYNNKTNVPLNPNPEINNNAKTNKYQERVQKDSSNKKKTKTSNTEVFIGKPNKYSYNNYNKQGSGGNSKFDYVESRIKGKVENDKKLHTLLARNDFRNNNPYEDVSKKIYL